MTTPADNTPYGIIGDSLRDCGRLLEGQVVSSEKFAEGMRRLRDLINLWLTTGLKLWTWSDTAVPLVAGQAVYSFAPGGDVDMTKPLRVLQGYYLYTATNVRRPIYVMAWNDYLNLGQAGTLTSNRGPISQYFVNKKQSQLDVTFWLCPDSTEAANGQAHVLLQTQIANPISLTETMNFPQEWRMALRWGLADDWSTGQPKEIMDRCAQKAAMYKEILEAWDVEDAPTVMQADPRMAGDRSFV